MCVPPPHPISELILRNDLLQPLILEHRGKSMLRIVAVVAHQRHFVDIRIPKHENVGRNDVFEDIRDGIADQVPIAIKTIPCNRIFACLDFVP